LHFMAHSLFTTADDIKGMWPLAPINRSGTRRVCAPSIMRLRPTRMCGSCWSNPQQKGALPIPSPIWERGRGEGLPSPRETLPTVSRVRRNVSSCTVLPSPLPLSHSGEGETR
jgi:hypothetical protein